MTKSWIKSSAPLTTKVGIVILGRRSIIVQLANVMLL